MDSLCFLNSNSNSIFIALNFCLKTDSRHTKQKRQKTLITNLRHSRGQCHGEKLRKSKIRVDMLDMCKEIGLSVFLNERREVAKRTSSGTSFQIFGAS